MKKNHVSPKRSITDPIEKIVGDALDKAGIKYVHESERPEFVPHQRRLDFLLPEQNVWIECKQFHSENASKQLQSQSDVILIQGRKAAHAFAEMIANTKQPDKESDASQANWQDRVETGNSTGRKL